MKGYKMNRDRVRNDLDAILSGHMPVHRNNPKDGQTEYYYMMPQSDDEFTDYDIIDVPTKDTPNPRIQSPQINYNQRLNSNVPDNQNILKNYYKSQKIANEILPTVVDMGQEYFNMKNHDFKYLDDYHHCKANFNVAQENEARAAAARFAGDAKELFDYYARRIRMLCMIWPSIVSVYNGAYPAIGHRPRKPVPCFGTAICRFLKNIGKAKKQYEKNIWHLW